MFRSLRDGRSAPLLAFVTVMAAAGLPPARARQVASAGQVPAPQPQEATTVYLLDVRINDWSPGLVARFVEQNGRLRIPAQQFSGLGFEVVEEQVELIDGERWIWLDRVPGLTYALDRAKQEIDLHAPYSAIRTNRMRVSPGVPRVEARANWGAMLAWDAFGQWSAHAGDPLFSRAWSVNLDARIFSPLFTAINRSVVTGGEDAKARYVRLESYVDFDDPEHSRRLRIGDTYTAGPIWVRTMRFGGIQWGSEFSLRPDIITTPVPLLDHNIALPSTVDLFINGVQNYSNALNPGPVRLSDLPVVTGANQIRAVITDNMGRRTEVVLPFYTSPILLAKGMTDFNVSAGFPRENYNIRSNDYGPFFATGVISRGISNRLTLRGYAAASKGFWVAGGGGTVQLGGFAVIDGAVLHSSADGDHGWGFYGAISRTTQHFNFAADYARGYSFVDLPARFQYDPVIERATASMNLNFGHIGQLNLLYAFQRNDTGSRTNIVSGTYSIDVGRRPRMHLAASGYTDTSQGDWGAILSLSLPIGGNTQVYAQQSWRNGAPTSQVEVQGQGFRNRLDWQLRASRGESDSGEAELLWDGQKIDLMARASRIDDSTGFQAEVMQSLIFMDGNLFLAGRIDDGFTVVDVPNSPGVRVALENREVGRTGKSGHLLVTDLQSYLPNAISIDPLDLPLDAVVADHSLLVAPRGSAGMVTEFKVARARSALVTLQLPDGKAPPAGALVKLVGSDFEEPMGFGGEIFVRGLTAGENQLALSWRGGACTARFTADVIEGTLPRLGPYPCVP